MLICALDVGLSKAQVLDPASATLFKGSSSPEPADLDDESDRFTKSAKPVEKAVEQPVEKPKLKPKSEEPAQVVNGQSPAKTETKAESNPPAAAQGPAAAQQGQPAAAKQQDPHPSLGEQVKVLLMGGNPEEIEDYKRQIDPRDRRNNRVELAVAPSYFYDNSSSNYSFRRLSSQGPAVSAEADGWLTPFLGLHAGYFSSLDSSVTSQGPKQTVNYEIQNMDFGINFRKHFGITRKAPSLTWQLRYVIQQSNVPADTPDRVSTTTSGLSVGLQADLPQSLSYSYVLGVEIQPKLVHSESSNADIHSGGSTDTNAVGAWIGGDWTLDRQNQVYWRVQERVEQNSFDGKANVTDPESGIAPSGVSVTRSTTLFSIGYRWGS